MKKFITLCIIAIFFAACGGKTSLENDIAKIEKAIEKFEKNKGKMTEADWQSLNDEVEIPLQNIQKALESDKVGAFQKMKLFALTAQWAAVLLDAGFNEIENQTGIKRENWGEELEKFNDEIEQAVQEWEKSLDEEKNNLD